MAQSHVYSERARVDFGKGLEMDPSRSLEGSTRGLSPQIQPDFQTKLEGVEAEALDLG
jgi:hypothetical protein